MARHDYFRFSSLAKEGLRQLIENSIQGYAHITIYDDLLVIDITLNGVPQYHISFRGIDIDNITSSGINLIAKRTVQEYKKYIFSKYFKEKRLTNSYQSVII